MNESFARVLNDRLVAGGHFPRWSPGYRMDIAEVGMTGVRAHWHSPHEYFTVSFGSISESGSDLDAAVRALHEKLVGLKERTATWEGRMIRPDALLRAFGLEEAGDER